MFKYGIGKNGIINGINGISLSSSVPVSIPGIVGEFSPSSISGLTLWFDAADLSTITVVDTNRATQWDDKSGNGYHLTSESLAASPITGTRTLNGLNAIDAIPATRFRTDLLILPQPFTVFSVVSPDSNISTPRIIWDKFLATYNNTNRAVFYLTQKTTYVFNAFLVGSLAFPNPGFGQAVIATSIADGQNSYFNLNQGIPLTENEGTSSWHIGTFGAGPTGGSWDGLMAEFIIYNRRLTAEEILQTENYLINKWGITT